MKVFLFRGRDGFPDISCIDKIKIDLVSGWFLLTMWKPASHILEWVKKRENITLTLEQMKLPKPILLHTLTEDDMNGTIYGNTAEKNGCQGKFFLWLQGSFHVIKLFQFWLNSHHLKNYKQSENINNFFKLTCKR